jgi:hypothetical protein
VTDLAHFAILAPVPEEHLVSGLQTIAAEGKVAFGTRKWELFRKIDGMRDGARVAVLIYPSHLDGEGKGTFVVSWFGWYAGSVEGVKGAHPDGMKYRPASTAAYQLDNQGSWATFWHVNGLRQLPAAKRLSIGRIEGYKGGWRKNAPPRGPELVTLPELLSYED